MADSEPIIDPSTLKRIDIRAAFSTRPRPIDFVLPGMPSGTVGGLISQGSAGKSWVGLEIVFGVAGGPDLLDLGIETHGSVLYLPAEDPDLAIEHRLFAAAPHLDAGARETVAENVEIVPLMGRPVDLLVPAWAELIARLGDGRRLILIDTLRRFHSGDENNGSEMVKLLCVLETICVRTGAAVLFLHHSSKGASLNDGGDLQQASRGSSVLVDNIRGGQINLTPMTKSEAKTHGVDADERKAFVRLSQPKTNYGPPLRDRWLRRGDGGLLLPAEIGGACDGEGREGTQGRRPPKRERGHG